MLTSLLNSTRSLQANWGLWETSSLQTPQQESSQTSINVLWQIWFQMSHTTTTTPKEFPADTQRLYLHAPTG